MGHESASETHSSTRRRRRNTAEVRENLLESGRRLFAAQGYEATTQRQIAAEAGVSTSVLFRHFGSKAQLLSEAVIEPFADFGTDVVRDLEAARLTGPPPGRLFAADLLGHLRRHRASLRALLTTLQSGDGDLLMGALGPRLDDLFDRIGAIAAGEDRGQREGPSRTDLALRLAVGMVTTLVVLDDWFLPAASPELDARLTEVLGNMISRTDPAPIPAGRSRTRPRGSPGAAASGLTKPRGGRRGRDEVREALLVAAGRSFAEKGFAATTYLEIAEAAHTSESALFRHFGSKANLLIEAVLEPFAEAFGAVSRRWAAVEVVDRRSQQPQFVADLYGTLVAHRQLLRILMGVANDPAHAEVNRAVGAWFSGLFTELAAQQEAQRSAEHQYEPDLRMRAALALIVGAGALDDWFLPRRNPHHRDHIVGVMSDLISRGRR